MQRVRWAALALLIVPGLLCANPRGATVVSGTATVNVNGKTLTIQQSTNQAIINWQAFENTPSETIRFAQPQSSSVTLNRVVGADPTLISGALQANGKVFVINPNGVVFGPGARVNVNSLVASSLSISDTDFKNGNYIFVQDAGRELSSVVNQGRITAASGGTVALIAPIVSNTGTVTAPSGRIILTASTHEAIDQLDPNVGVVPDAPGRSVRMAAIGLDPLLRDVVNISSVAPANKVQVLGDGTVFLRGAGGIAVNGGVLDVNGSATSAAGSVTVRSDLDTALAARSTITAVASGAQAASGSVDISPGARSVYYTPAGADGTSRATVQGGTVYVFGRETVLSSAAGGLSLKGQSVTVLAGQDIGTKTAPVRVAGGRVQVNAEGGIGLVVDGDVQVDGVASFGDVSITSSGSLLRGSTTGNGGYEFATGTSPDYINIGGDRVTVAAAGSIGTPAEPLSVYGGSPVSLSAPNGVFIETPTVVGGFAPVTSTTISLDNAAPVPRSPYVPPTDRAGGDGGTTIGGRDNVLLPSLRANLVKDDAENTSTTDAGYITVVRRDKAEESDDEKRLARRR